MGPKVHVLLLLALFTGVPGAAQSSPLPEDRGAAGIHLALAKLQTSARILYVVAHPDDEDAGTLTLLARGLGAEVTLLSLTRGEAGANLITNDFFDRLGALRTLEHQKAAAHYGVSLRYSRFADFGYSKNVEETWKNWDRQAVLADVVRTIRSVRPHVLIARFQGTARDGHGHHTASGLLAREAFTAAADPKLFAQAGPAWKTLKLYCNRWGAGEPGVFAVDSGVYNPLLGRSYAELGREGYRFQRSQAMGAVLMRPGPSVVYYKRIDRDVPEAGFLDGLGAETEPPASLRPFAAQAKAAGPLGEVLPVLLAGLQEARQLTNIEERIVWEKKFNHALNLALGLQLEASAPSTAAAGGPFEVTALLHSRGGERLQAVRYELAVCGKAEVSELEPGRFRVVHRGPLTAAHWTRPDIRQVRYDYGPNGEWGGALPCPPVTVRASYRVRGITGVVEAAPEVSRVDSIGLQYREPLVVGPGLSVRFLEDSMVLVGSESSLKVDAAVRNEAPGERSGVIRVGAPAGWRVEPGEVPYRVLREGEEVRATFRVTPAPGSRNGVLRARAGSVRSTFERVSYPGVGSLFLSRPAEAQVHRLDVRVAPGLKAGYVMGSGDAVPGALARLGVAVDLLDREAIAAADLSRYDVILLGIRAYAARPELAVHNQRLLEYVRRGGTLIVQYNTQEYDRAYGPYPYTMTRAAEEVSEENAPVTVLAPDHPVFHQPNRITAADWKGWFEQRGSKFFTTWDERWEPLIETHDTGQKPQRGVWLQARYGKGLYVYCSLAWYRQLPMAVPGAWRIFANLISQGAILRKNASPPQR